MRILMLGNSFTYFNDMDRILAKLLDAEVVAHTRGGAYLAEQLDETTELGMKTAKALAEEQWDYVVLQEYSNGPFLKAEQFFLSVKALCEKIRKNGAKPLLYATWAYHADAPKMADAGMKREEMFDALYEAYHKAAQDNDALIADVGEAFREVSVSTELYDAQDRYHPNLEGSTLAARVIADTIKKSRA